MLANSHNSIDLTASDIISMSDSFQESAILQFTNASGLFELIKEPVTAEKISESKGWLLQKTKLLLNALTSLKLVVKTGNKYYNTPSTNRFLTKDGSGYVGALIEHQRLQWQLWSKIGEVMSSEEPIEGQQEVKLKKDSHANDAFNQAMLQLSKENIASIAALPEMKGKKYILDLAGGHGTYLSAIAKHNPHVTGQVWDFATAREAAQKVFADYGVEDQIEFRTADISKASSYKSYNSVKADIAMLNDCLHYFEQETVVQILSQVAGLLHKKGDTLLITTMYMDRDCVTPVAAAGFSFYMMMNTAHGQLHPTPWLVDQMKNIGFDVEINDFDRVGTKGGKYVLIIGKRN